MSWMIDQDLIQLFNFNFLYSKLFFTIYDECDYFTLSKINKKGNNSSK